MFDFHGHRWGVTYLIPNGRLEDEQKQYLVFEATQMYLLNQEKRKVSTDSLEGRIWTKGDYAVIGSVGGQQFDAELDTNYGRVKVRFLVDELTGKKELSRPEPIDQNFRDLN